MFGRILASLMLVAIMASSVACYHMATVDDPAQYIAGAKPTRIWVTRSSDETLIVERPQLLGNTLVGYINGQYREIEVQGSERIVARQLARIRTAMAVGAGMAGVVGFAYLISGTGTAGDNRRFNQDCAKDPGQPGCE